MMRYQAPYCESLCWRVKNTIVPTIGPSIVPMPPITTMKIMYALHCTS